jgi:hypothetical protein
MNVKYQVIQRPEWSCPGMIVWVNESGIVIGIQTNPENSSTYQDVEDSDYFDSSDYAYVEKVVAIKSVAQIKAAYAAIPKSA